MSGQRWHIERVGTVGVSLWYGDAEHPPMTVGYVEPDEAEEIGHRLISLAQMARDAQVRERREARERPCVCPCACGRRR